EPYVGRFAPSPTGPLHAGSMAAAIASYLDAHAHRGCLLLRTEHLDPPGEAPGASAPMVLALVLLGLQPEGETPFHSTRTAARPAAFDRLQAAGRVYPCACTRREVADSALHGAQRLRSAELVYPGTCRRRMPAGRHARACRVHVDAAPIAWRDRRAVTST